MDQAKRFQKGGKYEGCGMEDSLIVADFGRRRSTKRLGSPTGDKLGGWLNDFPLGNSGIPI